MNKTFRLIKNSFFGQLFCALVCLMALTSAVCAQRQPQPAPTPDIEVLRVDTELVQSPVMVFDKQGHFVDGLQRDQFELRVGGKPQPITFFDRVTAGTPAELMKLQAARKAGTSSSTAAVGVGAPTSASRGSVYGRTLIFFVDDLHLSADSINRVRAALLRFIDESMAQNDRALLTTASGQLGFLQQLTDNKDVLRAAAGKLKPRQSLILDEERPPMAAYQALSIELNNTEVLKYYVEMYFADAVQNMNKDAAKEPIPGSSVNRSADEQNRGESGRRIAEVHVRSRARNILNQYTSITAASFASLRYLMASSLDLPGSKLIYVISDGFYLNRGVAGESQKLKEVTSAALRAGAVIYSIQASGLGSSYPDAKTDLRQGSRMPMNLPRSGSDQELQAPLYTLAVDTGGRGLFNSNSIEASIKQALAETSEYYLIAWRPETAEQRAETFKEIQVSVKDRPELSVRVHKGYQAAPVNASPTTATKAGTSVTPPVNATAGEAQAVSNREKDEKITGALSASYPIPDLPTSVNARFSDVPAQGPEIMVGTEISTGALFRSTPDDRQTRAIDLMGIVLNDEGKTVASFKGQLKAEPESGNTDPTITQNTEVKVKPGLYQVRVAARDQQSGVVGSASQWIMVPDLSKHQIALSSLFVGERRTQPQPEAGARIPLSISHHFTPNSRLRFFASIYNAASGPAGGGKPDVTVQTRILKDDQAVLTSPVVKVATEGVEDLGSIPYAAEVSLRTLTSGSYVLQLTATDNATKSSTIQRVKFIVE
ncbi:MAG TPA: VWA domain-containing protein [Pyrinomonadaceae bacterium]|jgi:VWFA-related protein|nr:VWA domain-containing protein [Pyrinomonadaceae bacterium]